MARKPGTRTVGEFVLFDVYYEDGTQRSNRRVPASALGGLDGDEPAKAIIAEQDAEIAEKSGQPRGPIKSIRRAGEPEPRSLQKSEREARRQLGRLSSRLPRCSAPRQRALERRTADWRFPSSAPHRSRRREIRAGSA